MIHVELKLISGENHSFSIYKYILSYLYIYISNGVSTIEPIKTCKSLRPGKKIFIVFLIIHAHKYNNLFLFSSFLLVIIICKESVGAKGGFFKTNFRSLAQMFNLDVALSSFSYIFTKFKNNEQANILDEIRFIFLFPLLIYLNSTCFFISFFYYIYILFLFPKQGFYK